MPTDARHLWAHPAHFIALGFGAGLAPRAPGSIASLIAFPLYWVLSLLPSAAYWLLIGVFFAVGIWACARTAKALKDPDPSSVVWDEIVAFLTVLPFAPAGPWGGAVAFGLFRLFDIVKPFPIRWLEAKLKGGLGIMFDDLMAALYANLCLWDIARWM